MKLLFEKSCKGAATDYFPQPDGNYEIPPELSRQIGLPLAEVAEVDLVRHYSALARRNAGVDQVFYPLGSCTMKYNPRLNEALAALPGFSGLHPFAPPETAQGFLEILFELKAMLGEITGMDAFTLAPMAGAHGEWTGIFCIRKYHEHNGDADNRTEILVPDSAHGTNPASASMCGFNVIPVKSNEYGMVDVSDLADKLSEHTAGLMLTNPNTLGIFEENIVEIARMVHDSGGLLYYDGANLNAICGIVRPGDMGFDVIHLNLHKTFGTPHGGGGPGAGPVGVKSRLAGFLPLPDVEKSPDGEFRIATGGRPESIGRIGAFYGNAGVCLKAYAYLLRLGRNGLKEAAENSVLNANYMKARLRHTYPPSHQTPTFHEFVCTPPQEMLERGVHTLNIAKRLIDKGFHPMTVYFPLVVKEAMMIEPTETESMETLDGFIDAMLEVRGEALENPDLVRNAPHSTPVKRVDEVKAAKELKLVYERKT